jgi:mono/diheme cytochrome c family protein
MADPASHFLVLLRKVFPMKKGLWLAALALVGFSLSCASLLPIPQESDLAYASYSHRAPVQLKDLQMGRKLYVAHCAACHSLHLPNELAPSGWERIMEKMQVKAKIDDGTKDSILLYVTTMAGK